jgi:hypothetical protein
LPKENGMGEMSSPPKVNLLGGLLLSNFATLS